MENEEYKSSPTGPDEGEKIERRGKAVDFQRPWEIELVFPMALDYNIHDSGDCELC